MSFLNNLISEHNWASKGKLFHNLIEHGIKELADWSVREKGIKNLLELEERRADNERWDGIKEEGK